MFNRDFCSWNDYAHLWTLDWIQKNISCYLSKVSLTHTVWVDKFTQPRYLKGYNRGSSARLETFASITRDLSANNRNSIRSIGRELIKG